MDRIITFALSGALCAALLAPRAAAADKPPAFHVASIEFLAGARLEGDILQSCDVKQIVTNAIQREKSTTRKTTELVLRIDRVGKLRGQPPPRPSAAGTELGVSILAVGTRTMDQPFLCRKNSLMGTNALAHCARLEKCSQIIADQVSTWLSGS
jgi:hypothetical protein